jgi:hypothetical protein
MAIAIRAPKDFWPGLMFVATGVAAVVIGRESSFGTVTKMGPAYFPTVLGGLLAVIGLALIGRAVVSPGGGVGPFAFRPLVLVLGATLGYGLIVRGTGLVVAVIALVLVSAAASRLVRWPSAIALAAGLAVFTAVIFVKVLGLPIPLVGAWFGR